jgi:hypothetical protein
MSFLISGIFLRYLIQKDINSHNLKMDKVLYQTELEEFPTIKSIKVTCVP